MGVESVSLTIAAFVCAALAIASGLSGWRHRRNLAFAGMVGSLFLHDTLCVVERFQAVIPFNSPRLHGLAILALAPFSQAFLLAVLPGLRPQLSRLWWIYLPLLIAVIAIGFFPGHAQLSVDLSHLVLVMPTLVWLSAFAWAAGQTTLQRDRLRYRHTFYGGLLTLAFFATDAFVLLGLQFPPLGTFARLLYFLFVFQIFIQRQLLTASEVAARLALFGGLAVVLAVIYSLLMRWVGSNPGLSFFSSFIASSVILILFDPIRKATANFTRRFFLRRQQKLEKDLQDLIAEANITLGEPAQVALHISQRLTQILGAQNASLFLLERDGYAYSRFPLEEPVQEIPSTHPLVAYLFRRQGKPFLFESLETQEPESGFAAQALQECRQMLQLLRADLVIPFFPENRLIGFLTLQTSDRTLFSHEWLRLLAPLAHQLSLILRNVDHFSRQRDRDRLTSLGEIAANLAHEIKNPLGAIKGAAEVLQQKGIDNFEQEDFLKIIIGEADRLSHVLNELLDYAKPRRYHPQRSCDLLRVIHHTVALCQRERGVEFTVEHDGPVMLEADPEMLKQVFLNLFLNAIQAMEQTPFPQVRVRIHRPINARFWEITVQDNGPGIPKEAEARLFRPFFTTKPKGTGLGLAICQRLIEGAGGTIQARPSEGAGAKFILHLPAQALPALGWQREVFAT